MPAALSYPPPRDVVARTLIWAGAAACVGGFLVHRMWTSLPAARFGETLVLAALAVLLAWPCVRLRQWAWADALALVWCVALAVFGGLVPALAVAILVATAMTLGAMLAGAGRPWLAGPTGAALVAGVAGWGLPFAVHRTWVYALVCAVVIMGGRHILRLQGGHAWTAWRGAVDSAPRAAAWSVVALGLASAGSWLPTMQYDDLAYHLGLPWQLLLHGRYTLDPTHQVWALAPWAGDVLHGIAQVIARAEARGALNAVWLASTAVGLWCLCARLGMRPAMRWGVLALFASLPLLTALTAGMQTELPAAAVTVALAALVFEPEPRPRDALVIAVLTGFLLALKPLHAITALPLVGLGVWRCRSLLRAVPRTAVAMPVVAAAIGGASYAYAWWIAGNPVLPLFNATFRSPCFAPQDFSDGRWSAGFDATLPWDMTFRTSAYLEGWDGGFGFVLVAFAGAVVAALTWRETRALMLCALVALLAPLVLMQYARYAFVGLVLLLPPAVAACERALSARTAAALVACVVVLNLAYQSNANWMLHTGAIKRAVGTFGQDEPLLARYAPERVLAARIRSRSANARVLDLEGAAHAEFAGHGRTTTWYAPRWETARVQADGDASGLAWSALLRRERITDVLLRPASLTAPRRAGLQRIGAHPAMTVGEAQWWRIPQPGVQ